MWLILMWDLLSNSFIFAYIYLYFILIGSNNLLTHTNVNILLHETPGIKVSLHLYRGD